MVSADGTQERNNTERNSDDWNAGMGLNGGVLRGLLEKKRQFYYRGGLGIAQGRSFDYDFHLSIYEGIGAYL
jgi:hypothetical protein